MKRIAALVLALAVLTTAGASAADSIKPGGVIVFGASGQAGSDIIKLLVAKGETVTGFVRPSSDRKRIAGVKIALLEGDAMKAADVEAAMMAAKPRVAINALGRGRDQWGFWAVTQINITAAAKNAGVKELVYLSSVGVGDSAMAYTPEARERTKVVHAERLIAEENIKASGLGYVIIRIGGVNWYGVPATGKASLTEDRSVLGMIQYADLAQLTVDCIGNTKCANKTWASVDPTVKRPEGR
jgi:nucleoside-diphosphate-sugar epimerase